MIVMVAEKFLMARSLMRAFFRSPAQATKGAFQGELDGQLLAITWAEGHAVELAMPDEIDPKWREWRLEDLPIAPRAFQFPLVPRSEDAVRRLAYWMGMAHVLINACDAAREGELIFDQILRFTGLEAKKRRIERMWITDTTTEGLRRAWSCRQPHRDKSLNRLRQQGRARAECDWLWGINGTRYATEALRGAPGIKMRTISIGRTRTPLLGMIADRCREAAFHDPEPYYRAKVVFVSATGDRCEAKLMAPPNQMFGRLDTDWRDRLELEERLTHMRMVAAEPWTVIEGDSRAEQEFPPPPFDTNDLYRTANRLLGWSAKRTAMVAQELYERHDAISYPRTDSWKLPLSMQVVILERAERLWTEWLPAQFPSEMEQMPEFEADEDRYFEEQVGDHYAIIPTGVIPPRTGANGGSSDAYALWSLITLRFLGAWLPAATVLASSRAFTTPYVEGEQLRAIVTAAPVVDPAWLVFEDLLGTTRGTEKKLARRLLEKELPDLGPRADMASVSLQRMQTHPPELFTYDSLLQRMEKEGIGTPATQAELICTLIEDGVIAETPNHRLDITEEGEAVVANLRSHGGELLLDTKLTSFWEKQLDKVGKGGANAITREQLLEHVLMQIRDIGVRMVAPTLVEDVVFCPKTSLLVETEEGGWRFGGWPDVLCPREINSRPMKASEYRDVLSARGGAGPFEGFISRNTGNPYAAWLVFDKATRRFNFAFKRRRA